MPNPITRNPSQPTSTRFQVVDWGRLEYAVAHERQLGALLERIEGTIPDTVYLVEHAHVYTYGRGSASIPNVPSTVFDQSVSNVAIERGGDVTYHGPGQLVAYPIVDVRTLTGDLHRFLRWLEDVLIVTVAEWGIVGRRHPEYTGVWVGDRKIASIGVAVKKWISYHGVALNVNTDLRYFSAIQPCGLTPEVMTSMEQLLGAPVPFEDVNQVLARSLESVPPTSALGR